MYAVIDNNGKQYKVSEGDRLEIDLCDAEPGDTIEFDKVIFTGGDEADAQVGTPVVEGVTVQAEVEEEIKAKKVIHYALRRRKDSRRKKGHRQRYLRVRITSIGAPGKKKKAAKKEPAVAETESE